MSVVLVMSTAPEGAVDAIIGPLLDERLVACANVSAPVRSVYRWQGGIEESHERVLLFKTTEAQRLRLRERLTELHPYEVPEILEWEPTGGAAAYLQWVAASCTAEE